MELLSERYGWTPREIREMSVADVSAYIEIINARARLQEEAAERNAYGNR